MAELVLPTGMSTSWVVKLGGVAEGTCSWASKTDPPARIATCWDSLPIWRACRRVLPSQSWFPTATKPSQRSCTHDYSARGLQSEGLRNTTTVQCLRYRRADCFLVTAPSPFQFSWFSNKCAEHGWHTPARERPCQESWQGVLKPSMPRLSAIQITGYLPPGKIQWCLTLLVQECHRTLCTIIDPRLDRRSRSPPEPAPLPQPTTYACVYTNQACRYRAQLSHMSIAE